MVDCGCRKAPRLPRRCARRSASRPFWQASGDRSLHRFRGRRRAALLSAARSAARGAELRAVRRDRQERQRSRKAGSASGRGVAHAVSIGAHPISRLENGPPIGFPVQFRVSGPEIGTVRHWSEEVAKVMRANPDTTNVQFDWDEPAERSVHFEVDQTRRANSTSRRRTSRAICRCR
jgi:multidrug efflux pump subunit AcrB